MYWPAGRLADKIARNSLSCQAAQGAVDKHAGYFRGV
jgi:hypothetical protein